MPRPNPGRVRRSRGWPPGTRRKPPHAANISCALLSGQVLAHLTQGFLGRNQHSSAREKLRTATVHQSIVSVGSHVHAGYQLLGKKQLGVVRQSERLLEKIVYGGRPTPSIGPRRTLARKLVAGRKARKRLTLPSSATEAGEVKRRTRNKPHRQPPFAGARC